MTVDDIFRTQSEERKSAAARIAELEAALREVLGAGDYLSNESHHHRAYLRWDEAAAKARKVLK
jgi:hypothetical protein